MTRHEWDREVAGAEARLLVALGEVERRCADLRRDLARGPAGRCIPSLGALQGSSAALEAAVGALAVLDRIRPLVVED